MMFKLHYLDGIKGDNNAFALYGSLCHSLLEDYEKGNRGIAQPRVLDTQ